MPNPSYGLIENFRLLFSEPVFSGTIWAGFTEFWKDARQPSVQDESVGDFFSRRFSKPTVDRILSAIIHGIYAGDVYKLSAKSLFNGPWRDELSAGSVFAGMMKSRAEGLEVTKREAEYLQDMKSFQWEPLLRGTLQGTSVFTFKEGLGQLSDAFARYLMGAGNVEFRTSTPVESIALSKDQNKIEIKSRNSAEFSSFNHAICTLSPGQLNKLHDQSSTALVPQIPSTTVMTVNLYYRTPDLNPPGFGYLIPQATPFENNPERALGVVFDTAYSPSPKDVDTNNWQPFTADALKDARESGKLVNVNDFAWYNMPAPPNIQDFVPERGTKLTVMLGGHWWDGWPAYPDEQEGLALAKSLLERHLGITEEPEVWQVNLQKDCIPQYTVGHEDRLKTAHSNLAREYKSRLRVAGSWMSGVGINDCLRSAWDVARNLKAGRSGTGLEHVGTTDFVRLKPVMAGQKEEESL